MDSQDTNPPNLAQQQSSSQTSGDDRLIATFMRNLLSAFFNMSTGESSPQSIPTDRSTNPQRHPRRGLRKETNSAYLDPLNTDYLTADFDPWTLTVPYTRKILAKHGITTRSSMSKDQIGEIWINELRPRMPEFRARIQVIQANPTSRASGANNVSADHSPTPSPRAGNGVSSGRNVENTATISGQRNNQAFTSVILQALETVPQVPATQSRSTQTAHSAALFRQQSASSPHPITPLMTVTPMNPPGTISYRFGTREVLAPQATIANVHQTGAAYVQRTLFTVDRHPIQAWITTQQAQEIETRQHAEQADNAIRSSGMGENEGSEERTGNTVSIEPQELDTETRPEGQSRSVMHNATTDHEILGERVVRLARDIDNMTVNPWTENA